MVVADASSDARLRHQILHNNTMKKIFSVLVAALVCSSVSAQQLKESFDGESFPPEGWTVINANQYSAWTQTTKEGRTCAMVPGTYGYENYLITPQLKPEAGEKLTFDARVGDYASKGELRIEVSLTGTDKSSFTVVETFYTSRNAESNGIWKTEWSSCSVDLSAYVGQRIFVAFHQYGEAEKIYIDDVKGVSLAGSETCDAPTNLTVSNITDEGATVTWQGEATTYQYALVPAGEAPDWTMATLTTEKSVTFAGLSDEMAFDCYVRAYCSDEEQSLAPKASFKTICGLQSLPWIETFTRDATGEVEPECWTVSSANPQVWVVADKTYDEEGNAQTVYGQAHLFAGGGGQNTAQVFALPAFEAQLNTLEIAFDYKTSMVSDSYGVPEIGYMTNPSDAKTFVSLKTLEQTLTYKRETCSLAELPADAKFVAFRFAGGSSDFGGLSMDNFVVAEIGQSGEIDPSEEELPDAAIYGMTYCEAQFTWYSYNSEAFAIGLFDAEAQSLIGGIVVTTGECDRFAYSDGVKFSADDDYENHYYCSTKWILNVDDDGVAKGDAWGNCVINIGTAVSPTLGLKPGKYQVQVYAYSTTAGRGDLLTTIPFELVAKVVSDLKAEVSSDKKTATLSWSQPALSTGERVYVSVRAGETVAYDNFEDNKQRAESPLTLNVVEGKSYNAIVQILDKNNNPLGGEVECNFTVGVNNYEPTNVHAEVFGGDNVTFSWEAETLADFYELMLYADGDYYSRLTVYSTTKTTTMPKNATWSWTVQPFTKGSTGKYFAASNPVAGNDFVSKAADVPEDAVVMEVWGMDAAYLDEASGYYQEGKHGWLISFATGEEGGTGMPMPYFLLYTAKERAISGVYNVARENLDLESCYINTNGRQSDAINATDAEVRLQFDGYDEEKAEQGYRYGYYTGQFRLVGDDGKTYIGKFMELFCNSFSFSTYNNTYRDHLPMWDEDPSFTPFDAVENASRNTELDLSKPMYNIMGVQVGKEYKGIVIQGGKKFMLQ